eukprot:s1116_g10.t1
MAAEAQYEAWICGTFFSLYFTAVLSPPLPALPQVTTDPLHSTAVTTPAIRAPGHDRSVTKNGGKSIKGCLDLLHILQLFLYSTTVATAVSFTPADDGSIIKNGGNSTT